MYKEMVIAALNADEVSMNLKSQVRRKGGIENLTEETARTICRICRTFMDKVTGILRKFVKAMETRK